MWRLKRHGIDWLNIYLIGGIAYFIKVLVDVYHNTVSICELYPRFSFRETFMEEWMLHHTLLPILNVSITTILLFGIYLMVYFVIKIHLFEILWVFITEFIGGAWIYDIFYWISSRLSFIFGEPQVPELVSDDEEEEYLRKKKEIDEGDRAFKELMKVKKKHANMTVARPEDWLVYDPKVNGLVFLKNRDSSSPSNSHTNVTQVPNDIQLSGSAINTRSKSKNNESQLKKKKKK